MKEKDILEVWSAAFHRMDDGLDKKRKRMKHQHSSICTVTVGAMWWAISLYCQALPVMMHKIPMKSKLKVTLPFLSGLFMHLSPQKGNQQPREILRRLNWHRAQQWVCHCCGKRIKRQEDRQTQKYSITRHC